MTAKLSVRCLDTLTYLSCTNSSRKGGYSLERQMPHYWSTDYETNTHLRRAIHVVQVPHFERGWDDESPPSGRGKGQSRLYGHAHVVETGVVVLIRQIPLVFRLRIFPKVWTTVLSVPGTETGEKGRRECRFRSQQRRSSRRGNERFKCRT